MKNVKLLWKSSYFKRNVIWTIKTNDYGNKRNIKQQLQRLWKGVSIASTARIMQRGALYTGDDSQWWLWWFIEMVVWVILIIEGIKRSHDTGSSGWYILIPFYGLVLLFKNSEVGINK